MLRFIRKRRGVASLEFVMCLPFIVLVAAIIFRIGIAAVHKTKVAVDVRREVWQARDQFDASKSSIFRLEQDDTTPLSMWEFRDSLAGVIDGEARSNVRVYEWLGGDKTAISKSSIVGGTWDHRQMGDLLDDNLPHLEIIAQILGSSEAAGWISDAKDLFAWLFGAINGDRIPLENDDEIDDANEDVEEAEAEYERQRQELVDKKQEAEAQLVVLRQERQDYINERDALESERRTLRDNLATWRAQASEQDPVDPALQQQIDAAEDRIDEIDDRLEIVRAEIRRLDTEIDRKEREVEEFQEQIDNLDEAVGG